MTKRKLMTQQADGSWVESTFDATWSEILPERIYLLKKTDTWYLSDRWAQLTSEQQTALNTFRQTLRDLPQNHDNANDAFDNFPDPEDWMVK
jgi:hypothetical protein|tara:strand:+ start:676 stop:951 length:276 start_codon:yes stop_codon:yes gene_type:complete